MEAPPVLTAERIDAMLSILAEVCLESVVEAGRRQKAAEDFDEFERGGRALQRAGRNLRQTIALKQRHDRDEARKADEARKVAEGRREAERVRRERIEQKRAGVARHFSRQLWDEYEPEDARELFDDLEARLRNATFDDDFLETPVPALIQRLSDELGLDEASDEPPTPAPAPVGHEKRPSAVKPHSTAEVAEASAEIAETPALRVLSRTSATSAVDASACGAPEAPPPATAQPPPPAPPPDPPPEPYVPPWERLRPGERMPGGSGW